MLFRCVDFDVRAMRLCDPMYHGVYILWALLPFTLLSLSAWAVLKKVARIQGREDARQYFQQFLYTLVCLVLSILFDQYCLDSVLELTGGMLDDSLARWFIYPAMLVLLGALPLGKRAQTPKSPRFVYS